MYSLIVPRRSRTLSDLISNRIFTRLMGGGPRTFPGGVNKWQWKRLHEKKAKEKEKRLLDQEKQLYQARFRSQIRSKLAGKPDPDPDTAIYTPMNPKDHIKALADRFMKEGTEDLWNENDGLLKSPLPKSNEHPGLVTPNQRPGSINSPIDLRKVVSAGRNISQKNLKNGSNFYNYTKARGYSVQRGSDFGSKSNSVKPSASHLVQKQDKFRRNESSSSEHDGDDSDFGFINDPTKHFTRNLVNKRGNVNNPGNVSDYIESRGYSAQKQSRFQRNQSPSSGDDDGDYSEEEGVRKGGSLGEIESRAALGKHDVKITKRMPLLKELERKSDSVKEGKLIGHELGKKKFIGNEGKKGEEEIILSDKRFDECGISPLTVKALTAAGYVQMTRVQEATLSVCLEGKDALVKANTGKGKSAVFLLPAIEAVLKATSSNANPQVPPIYVLILCPTRELASQTVAEANAMLRYHDGIGVQTLVGGIHFKVDQKCLQSNPCQIIVATPGQLLDHIENKGGLSVPLMGLKMLILDEADHLLDLGFRKDVEKIVDCLPHQRQSLLFSATIPKEVRQISQLVLKREHAFIDTVGLGCVETPTKIKQSYLIVPHELHFQAVHHLLKMHMHQIHDYKVIVFCTTGMVTSLMCLLLREMKMNVREMHSRKPHLYRTGYDEFSESKRLILVTSDVSACGMNYPDVTLVLQVGIPLDREQYIHRLGRTGREGKDGEGILLLAPWEEYFIDELKDLPVEKVPVPHMDPKAKLKMEDSMSKIDNRIKAAAYYAWLGYYNSIREIGKDKTRLVELANQFSESIGLQKPPPLNRKTALEMGLKDIPGIRIRR